MFKYSIIEHKHCKAIFDLERAVKKDYKKSNTECTVKRFPTGTADEEILKYIEEKLGGNKTFSI